MVSSDLRHHILRPLLVAYVWGEQRSGELWKEGDRIRQAPLSPDPALPPTRSFWFLLPPTQGRKINTYDPSASMKMNVFLMLLVCFFQELPSSSCLWPIFSRVEAESSDRTWKRWEIGENGGRGAIFYRRRNTQLLLLTYYYVTLILSGKSPVFCGPWHSLYLVSPIQLPGYDLCPAVFPQTAQLSQAESKVGLPFSSSFCESIPGKVDTLTNPSYTRLGLLGLSSPHSYR